MSINLTTQKILKDWTDYNNHMNVAYYVLIFDLYGAEKLMTLFNMGEDSAKNTKKSTMVVESHITYNQEVNEGDEVDVNLLYFDHDKKRLQYKLEMVHKEKNIQHQQLKFFLSMLTWIKEKYLNLKMIKLN